ncbi:MAG: uracil-DNA glycosylase [Candidatus Eisenbacteria bacterium]|nr:uracil-DNA glycosylase [Candidatus Eisenbacteria bacterium]
MKPSSRRLALAYFRQLRDLGEHEILRVSPGAGAHQTACSAEGGSLDAIARDIAACTACGLHKGRVRVVPGSGNPTTGLVLVGEAPGEQEDCQGLPFVGPSGRLLRRLLRLAGVSDDSYYIVNVLKCRPPGNRDPLSEEVDACAPFFHRQLAALAPRLIICLGRFAGRQVLANEDVSIRAMRGNVHQRGGARVILTYHPSALLHRVEFRADAWRDIKRVRRLMTELGLPREAVSR